MSTQFCKHGVEVGAQYHDCAYVDYRVSMVPLAEAFADTTAGPRPEAKHGCSGAAGTNERYEAWARLWNICFHEFITRRVRERFGERS